MEPPSWQLDCFYFLVNISVCFPDAVSKWKQNVICQGVLWLSFTLVPPWISEKMQFYWSFRSNLLNVKFNQSFQSKGLLLQFVMHKHKLMCGSLHVCSLIRSIEGFVRWSRGRGQNYAQDCDKAKEVFAFFHASDIQYCCCSYCSVILKWPPFVDLCGRVQLCRILFLVKHSSSNWRSWKKECLTL